MRYSALIILVLFLFSPDLYAQKKKNKYDTYWEQEAKNERLKVLNDSAHKSFQNGNLAQAIELYKAALKVIPDHQYTLAKLQDLEILNTEIREIITKMGTQSKLNIQTNIPELELVHSVRERVTDEVEFAEPIIDTLASADTSSIIVEKTQEKEIVEPAQNLPARKEPKPVKASNASESTFDLKTFRQEIAQSFPEGFSEEEYRQGRKIITRRVVVSGSLGDEYLKVKHDYGATFYFKNKQYTDINIWLLESKGKKKD